MKKTYHSDRNLIFTDVEATGLDPTQHEIVSLACIVLSPRGEVLERKQWFMHPRWLERADPIALDVNGYTKAGWDSKGVVSHEQALSEFLVLASDCMFVAHNVTYDWTMLLAELDRLGLQWTGKYKLDTCSIFWPIYLSSKGKMKGIGLGGVCKYFGISNEGAHDSLVDVDRLVQAYLMAMKELGVE